jgi:hypothetical protein
VTRLYFEGCFALLVVALAVWAPLPPVPAVALLVLLLGLSFLPGIGRPAGEGKLRRDHFLVLMCVFLMSSSVRLPLAEEVTGWWPAVVAFLLVLAGLLRALKDRPVGWGRLRREMALAVVVLLVLSAAAAGMLRGVLAFRSTRAIAPGSLDFLPVMFIWAGAWFGLDAYFRGVRDSTKLGVAAWLFNHRHPLGLGVCLLVILVRSG